MSQYANEVASITSTTGATLVTAEDSRIGRIERDIRGRGWLLFVSKTAKRPKRIKLLADVRAMGFQVRLLDGGAYMCFEVSQ